MNLSVNMRVGRSWGGVEQSQALKQGELSSSQEADVIRASLDDKCSVEPMPDVS